MVEIMEIIVPILFLDKEECCGCSVCYAICSVGAINMEADEEGFEYPMIDSEKCVGCKKCVNVCSFKK